MSGIAKHERVLSRRGATELSPHEQEVSAAL
jgi:hypothetical protein